MGRFLAFLFVFILGGVIGFAVGGLGGAAAGAYVGACKVIDQAVTENTMTQDQANALLKSISNDLDIKPEQKQQIVDRLKKANAPPSPCSTAIQAL
jgi:polyhydroxyalkanoate synthesis regulator phasin